MADAYSFEELNALRIEVESAPESRNPAHLAGRSILIYSPAAMRKLDALAWAVTYKLAERKAA